MEKGVRYKSRPIICLLFNTFSNMTLRQMRRRRFPLEKWHSFNLKCVAKIIVANATRSQNITRISSGLIEIFSVHGNNTIYIRTNT